MSPKSRSIYRRQMEALKDPLKYRQWVIQQLRRASHKWPALVLAKEAAKTRVKKNEYTGRQCMHFRCVGCEKEYPHNAKHLRMDHIKPVVNPKKGFDSFDTWIRRCFVPDISDYQPMCPECHQEKTNAENSIRYSKRVRKKSPKNKTNTTSSKSNRGRRKSNGRRSR